MKNNCHTFKNLAHLCHTFFEKCATFKPLVLKVISPIYHTYHTFFYYLKKKRRIYNINNIYIRVQKKYGKGGNYPVSVGRVRVQDGTL